MSKHWITDGEDVEGWTWIAAEKGDTRGLVLRAEDADRIVACVNALEGIEDPAAFMAAARPLIGNAAGLSMLIDTDDPAAEVALIGEQGMDLYRMLNP